MNAPSASSAWGEQCRLLAEPIAAACAATPVAAGPAALTKELGKHLPDWSFREILCRGGWYRLGGVVGPTGERVSSELEAWALEHLDQRDNDLAVLLEDFADSGLRATQWIGRTHYLVAHVTTSNNSSTDFLQLEIEDLQETLAHRLFARETPPATLDELIDARSGEADPLLGTPLAASHYVFRRLTHVGELLARMRTQSLEPQPIHRFVADWEASSAGHASAFCNHWALALREHLDRFKQTQVRAKPVAAVGGELPAFTTREGTSGLVLHNALQAFDRQVGYPFAWFFSLLTSKAVPHWLPAAVASDAVAGFSYLPDRDLAIVKQWLHKPYAF